MKIFDVSFSIIIPTFQSAHGLERTLMSIRNQSFKDYEVIVIDGGSQDGTIDVIRSHLDMIKYWVSEPDCGISDAFNKGVLASKGKFINFQGAGDTFASNDVLQIVANEIEKDDFEHQLVCGAINRVDSSDQINWTSRPDFKKWHLLFRMALPHQALFTHRDFFTTYGLFDVNNRFCMDYEILLRAYKNFPKVKMLDLVVSNWVDGGIGSNRELEIFEEYRKIKLLNKVAHPFIVQVIHYWTLVKFNIKKMIRT